MDSEKKISNPRRSWALGTSLILHSIVLLGLGAGSIPGPEVKSGIMVVYLGMAASITERTSVQSAISETTDIKTIPEQETVQHNGISEKKEKSVQEPQQTGIAGPPQRMALDSTTLDGRLENIDETAANEVFNNMNDSSKESVITNYQSPITSHQLPTADPQSPTTDHRSPITDHLSTVTDHRSPITDQSSTLLAFAGDPVSLGMLALDSLGPIRVEAEILSLPEPVYPVLSRKKGEEGRVVLQVFISNEGRVMRTVVQTPSSYPGLDRAALAAVQRATFAPAKENGIPVESTAKVAYRFELENR